MFRFSGINTLCKKSGIKTGKYDTNHDILFFGEMDCRGAAKRTKACEIWKSGNKETIEQATK